MESSSLMWYGYLHIDGSVHTKRYFGQEDIQECSESDFVECVYGPFECDSRDEAVEIVDMALDGGCRPI